MPNFLWRYKKYIYLIPALISGYDFMYDERMEKDTHIAYVNKLPLWMVGKKFNRQHFEIFFL